MSKSTKKAGMAANIIGAIVLVLVLFGIIVSTIGFVSFTKAFKKEYAVTTYHMADTATTLINGDHLDAYLAGEETEEYLQTREYLDAYCKKISVSLIYLIKVDRSDYGRFVSIFNAVDNTVDDTSYKEWELGHKRDTTNDEYRAKYKALYDKEAVYETVYRVKTTDGQHPHITTMVPVTDSKGDVVAILCMQRPVRELNDARRPYLIIIAVSTVLLAILASVFSAAFIKRQFVEPIKKVSEEASRFASENTKGVPLGDISRYSELSNLSRSIDTMESDMVEYVNNLTKATAEKERIGTELSLASNIQDSVLPNDFPAFPDRKDFDIYASMVPAKEVGGDFYNFFLIDRDHLAIVIGDVSGKGIPGALFMMVINILVSERLKMGRSPAQVLTDVNDAIIDHNESDMFVTLWVGIIELSTGTVVAANAGHDDAAVYHKNGKFELFKTKHNFVVGPMKGSSYKDFAIQLGTGDKLFLYTDGVPEANNEDGKLLGLDRMMDILNEYKKDDPKTVLDGVYKGVKEFEGDAPQFDDITMLCVELK
ncbi:MAG: SpoIIE family protein phosphatase [Firmicutes bacterium]|nr:SpoIIE family protein phosphatase [Bacillota bacterium]